MPDVIDSEDDDSTEQNTATVTLEHALVYLHTIRESLEDLSAILVVAGNEYTGGVLRSVVANLGTQTNIILEVLTILLPMTREELIDNASTFIAQRQAEALGEDSA